MGVSATNIVLVGDQMQLSQPIQGAHPGGSGISGLEHLLGGFATVPPDRGIFLGITFRMHPDICTFISYAVFCLKKKKKPRPEIAGYIMLETCVRILSSVARSYDGQ